MGTSHWIVFFAWLDMGTLSLLWEAPFPKLGGDLSCMIMCKCEQASTCAFIPPCCPLVTAELFEAPALIFLSPYLGFPRVLLFVCLFVFLRGEHLKDCSVGWCHYTGEGRQDKMRPVIGREGREAGTEVLEGEGEARGNEEELGEHGSWCYDSSLCIVTG